MEKNNKSLDIEALEPSSVEKNNVNENNLQAELETAKKKMKFWIIIGASLMVVSVFLIVLIYFSVVKSNTALKNIKSGFNSEKIVDMENTEIDKENLEKRLIDGVYVEAGKENILPVAIMIDNHVDARPQAGLEKAQYVIEAEAEGGITRYLAVFASGEKIDKIGPIRSARPYFIDWAKELSAVYVHVGGSPDALAKMIKENTTHINEFYNGEYFWRGTDFSAPHNVFISSEKIDEYLEKKELSSGKFLPWEFKDEAKKEERGTSTSVSINFIIPEYIVSWKYDQEKNDYTRYLGGQKHLVASGSELKAKNIIIQYVKGEVLDEAKRQSFHHIGEGKAVVCLDGFCSEGIWKKKGAEARTRFYDNEGKEFQFNAGTTWTEVVKPGYEVDY